MSQDHHQKLRLVKVLSHCKEEVGSYDKLARAIFKASDTAFDRRKLKYLIDGHDVPLRVSELRALDAYLAPLGEGLAARPIFEQSTILAEISNNRQAAFVLGSFPRKRYERADISHWDVRSMIEVLRSLNHYGQIQVDIEEVIYREDERKSLGVARRENWFRQLTDHRSSLICIGSPRVNRATEVMLAQMFGVAPFRRIGESDYSLPFRFVWPRDRKQFVSSFELDNTTVARKNAELAKRTASRDTNAMGLYVDRELLPVYRGGRRWLTYGVVAAQRRETGQIWLVLAGLTAAATFGVASAVWAITDAIPPAETGTNSDVLWAVVETSVTSNPKLVGDHRVVRAHRVMDAPSIWPIA